MLGESPGRRSCGFARYADTQPRRRRLAVAVSDGASVSSETTGFHFVRSAGVALNFPDTMSAWHWTHCLFGGGGATPVPSWQRLHWSSPTNALPWAASPGRVLTGTDGAAEAVVGGGGGGSLRGGSLHAPSSAKTAPNARPPVGTRWLTGGGRASSRGPRGRRRRSWPLDRTRPESVPSLRIVSSRASLRSRHPSRRADATARHTPRGFP